MIHNANGEQAYLHAKDLTGESETAEKLSEVALESVDIAKSLYSTDIFAVVSDNASAMIRMGKDNRYIFWHSKYNSHSGNLLAKDILNKTITDNVTCVLREFKQPYFEKNLVDKGGTKIKLPCDTRWCSYRDSFRCLITNLDNMKMIAADPKSEKVKPSVTKLLFDEEFRNQVNRYIWIFDCVCTLIDKCQSTDFSAADAVNLWLDMKLPEEFDEILAARKKKAISVYALTAYYLHPEYDNNKLSNQQTDEINTFLFKHLNADGLEEWDNVRE